MEKMVVQKMKKLLLFIAEMTLIIGIMIFETWMWWSAPCSFIKKYWYVASVPGRCL